MASELVKDLIKSGCHFGHRTSRWNPKMTPYIFGKRNQIHIIDIRETVKGILRVRKFLSRVVSQGDDVLFVGTKRQARASVRSVAQQTNMHFVVERWLGGTLTNFRTIRSRLARLEELEAIETDGMAGKYSKKMMATLNRERRKIHRNLEGIRRMERLPGALVLVDITREANSALEARKLKIPVVGLIDTDSDPDKVDLAIPCNDDAMRAIELILGQMGESIQAALRARPALEADKDGQQDRPARRSRRVTARADEPEGAVEQTGEGSPAEQGTATDQAPPADSTEQAEQVDPAETTKTDVPG